MRPPGYHAEENSQRDGRESSLSFSLACHVSLGVCQQFLRLTEVIDGILHKRVNLHAQPVRNILPVNVLNKLDFDMLPDKR